MERKTELIFFIFQENVLMFDSWYPYNATKEPYYTYTYILQSGMLFLTSGINSMIDSLVTSFYISMMGQIDILKVDFRELTDVIIRSESWKEKNLQILFANCEKLSKNSCSKKEYNKDFSIYRETIVNYVNRHKAILS